MTPPLLTAATTPATALIHPRSSLTTGIVHLGLGNFHRAHQAVYTAQALRVEDGPWGILGVANRSGAIVTAMRQQDLRYAVLEISPEGSEAVVPAVHTGAVVAADDPNVVVDAIGSSGTAIVTLTVTEHGYTYSPRTHRLDVDSPAVRSDLNPANPPVTSIGQIVRGLQRRVRTHGRAVTILSCDNLSRNGSHTGRLVREFVEAMPAAEQRDLLSYLDQAVTFPDSMVDRIVPTTTDAERQAVARILGVRDQIPVPAEPFSMWVMQDEFAAGRPAWEHGGAVFTDDVHPYEMLKLRLLNGTHSLIAYLGALDGRPTIPDSAARTFIADAARRVLLEDYLPSITVPDDIDLDTYVDQLFTRWSNSALGHGTHQVGSDGSVKLAQRIPEPALLHLDNGRMPHHLALTLAAYLTCVAPPAGYEPGPHAAAMSDPARAGLVALQSETSSSTAFVKAVLDGGLLGQDLAQHPEFITRTAEFRDILARHGSAAAAAEAAAASDHEIHPLASTRA
ncbi:fructuronate reductase [Nakamurella panacisegetis]|uniref:Mannitol-1-phosphate 5-dehydrogenase n=1 Tax=Nakamurella panacisegetis TaxID=1090615 RepID=A0A1H0IRU7_9ACTN|nr:mannitol dehydrogenase family protein [Nakamurella panacisegetis]SDO34187.1 fructuronate reductase [Nakamurella panacisegetis]